MIKTQEVVMAEIEESVKEYQTNYPESDKDLAFCMFFNKFYLMLPFSDRRGRIEQSGNLDKPIINNSKITNRQFYEDLDEIFSNSDLNSDMVKGFQQEAGRDIHKRKQLLELSLPIYVKLRELEYTRQELNS